MDLGPVEIYRDKILDNCRKIILGKDDVILHVLECFLCGGHILLEDIPGTGKTMLLRAFAKSTGLLFRRIQFTPDLLPSDLTGINFYNMKTQEFEFREGPLFAQVILADEINRATPRTQASMLEAMEERQITIDGTTYPMMTPFMVMATQNPLESFGTFALPEAQTDRFFMRLKMGYMEREQETLVIARRPASSLVSELECVVGEEETKEVQKIIREVKVSDEIVSYMMDLITESRNGRYGIYGVSARGGIALYSASQAHAALEGRNYVIPEDVRDTAVPVLAHRIGGSSMSMEESEKKVMRILEAVKVPTEEL